MQDEEEENANEEEARCPVCDTVVAEGATVCVMCGHQFETAQMSSQETVTTVPPAAAEAALTQPPVSESEDPTAVVPEIVSSEMRERQAPLVLIMTAVFTVLILILGVLIWQYRPEFVSLSALPTATPVTPTVTAAPTETSSPTGTITPTQMPSVTPTPAPSATLQPPRSHTVGSGETLFGLSFLYRVSADSIVAANELSANTQIQVNQNLLIPWPTPTPPLQVVVLDVNGQVVIADPRGCERYEVLEGDSIVAIANRFGIDFALLMQVNRITDATILQPGDTVCIPEIGYGSLADLPPTPGPSPTPTLVPPPAGPVLLYPVDGAAIEPADGIVRLQWVAVKDLAESEWYMIELTDEANLDGLPLRGFTRDTSYQVPPAWRPDVPETFPFCWRVSIVNVTGWRADGLPIYTYGGDNSDDACFSWLGALPTATPTATATASATPTPTATPE